LLCLVAAQSELINGWLQPAVDLRNPHTSIIAGNAVADLCMSRSRCGNIGKCSRRCETARVFTASCFEPSARGALECTCRSVLHSLNATCRQLLFFQAASPTPDSRMYNDVLIVAAYCSQDQGRNPAAAVSRRRDQVVSLCQKLQLCLPTQVCTNMPLPALLDACLAACDKDIRSLSAATW
jgi:hypothetical protein